MNLFAATMDVAVDGLAVDLLEESELGKGNIAQVVGYKIGILTGGGLLVWASGHIGWEGLFCAMGGLVAVSTLFTLTYDENRALAGGTTRMRIAPSLRVVLKLLRKALSAKGTTWLLVFVATYKLGESIADAMFAPFLVDAGFTAQQIGLWVGTWGLVFSIAGSISGGLLASRINLLQAVGITALLRAIPVAGEWWLSLVTPTANQVIVVTCAENFFGGALTTAMFAFMMSRVDRRIGATHFTLLAAIEVWGKLSARSISGVIADATSYPFVFGLAFALSVAYLILLVPLRRSSRSESEHA